MDGNSQAAIRNLLSLWDDQSDLDIGTENISPDGPRTKSAPQIQDIMAKANLHSACIVGDVEKVKSLIEGGADINVLDFEGKSPLELALREHKLDCAKYLLDVGCNITPRSLHRALRGHLSPDRIYILERLIPTKSLGPRDCGHNCSNGTDLHRLSRMTGPESLLREILQMLLHCGENLEATVEDGATPVLRAISNNNANAFRVLASVGANLNIQRSNGESILHDAALCAGLELLNCLSLADIDVDIESRTTFGNTALDLFTYCTKGKTSDFQPEWRKPTQDEIDAFEELLRAVRDRYLIAEIDVFSAAIDSLRSGELEVARTAMAARMERKKVWNKSVEYETLRVIKDVQISQGMVEAAIESLGDIILEHRKTMKKSPFARRTRYGYLKRK